MFGWLRRRRQREIPDALWAQTLQAFPFLSLPRPADGERLRALTGEFLGRKEFSGAGGFTVTDEVAVAIAAQAVLPVLHLGLGWYDDFVGIVVHPAGVVARRKVTDENEIVHEYDEELVGESMDQGPVMLSWQDVAGASPESGYNVVVHEFAHKLDLRDGAADGCPPLPSKAARRAWMETMQAAYDTFREQVIVAERFGGEPPWLDAYGATAIDEFFAVACEGYFVNPGRFARECPTLAPLFDSFFSPAGRRPDAG